MNKINNRPATSRPFFIQDADGVINEVNLTPKEFRETYEVGSSAVKKQRGRTGDNLPWARELSGLSDKRTTSGASLVHVEAARITDISLEDATSIKRYLPRSLTTDFQVNLRTAVDEVLSETLWLHHKAHEANENTDTPIWLDVYEGWITQRDVVDFARTKESADEIANDSWDDICTAVNELTTELSNEEHNKVIAWSRTRSRNIFDIRAAGQDGTFIRNQGVLGRLETLDAVGSDAVTRSNKVRVESGGLVHWIEADDIHNCYGPTEAELERKEFVDHCKQVAKDMGITYGPHCPVKTAELVKWSNVAGIRTTAKQVDRYSTGTFESCYNSMKPA